MSGLSNAGLSNAVLEYWYFPNKFIDPATTRLKSPIISESFVISKEYRDLTSYIESNSGDLNIFDNAVYSASTGKFITYRINKSKCKCI